MGRVGGVQLPGFREREMRVYDGVLRGYEDFCAGRVTPAREGLAALREKKGW